MTNTGRNKIVAEIPTQKIIEAYKKHLNIDVSDSFVGVEYVTLVRNIKTGHKFFLPERVAGQSEFYEALQKYDWYYQKNRWEFYFAKKFIGNGKLLEVGCGPGFFLETFNANKNIEVYGIEFNNAAVRICQSKELRVDKSNLNQLKESNYDYVVSFQVLEHISNYEDFFRESYRILKPGGRLIIGIPNTNSFVFYPFSNNYFNHGSLLLNLPPHHMGWWNKATIRKAGEVFQFKFIKSEFEPLPQFRFELVSSNISKLFYIPGLASKINKHFRRFYTKHLKGETMIVIFEK